MLKLDKILIDEDVLKNNFCCDLKKCKGGCCTFPGEFGAPLIFEEIAEIENAFYEAKKYLSEKSLNYIEENGFVEKSFDTYSTVCIDKKDCVFVFYDNEIAKCALEQAYLEGKTDFQKPLSCHLFPIRVSKYSKDFLYYQRFDECEPGRKLGEKLKLPLVVCLETSITRAYGKKTFQELLNNLKNGKK